MTQRTITRFDNGFCVVEYDTAIGITANPDTGQPIIGLHGFWLWLKEQRLRQAAEGLPYTITQEILDRAEGAQAA